MLFFDPFVFADGGLPAKQNTISSCSIIASKGDRGWLVHSFHHRSGSGLCHTTALLPVRGWTRTSKRTRTGSRRNETKRCNGDRPRWLETQSLTANIGVGQHPTVTVIDIIRYTLDTLERQLRLLRRCLSLLPICQQTHEPFPSPVLPTNCKAIIKETLTLSTPTKDGRDVLVQGSSGCAGECGHTFTILCLNPVTHNKRTIAPNDSP